MNYLEFREPKLEYYPRPLWFWNDIPTREIISEIMEKSKELSSYAGFGILPYEASSLQYMQKEYLAAYRTVLEKAKDLGLKICLYDEWWFPSGSAGGLLKKFYPKACAKRLDKIEYIVENSINIELPDGAIMAAVAMNENTLERIDLSSSIENDRLIWKCCEKDWKLMIFTCVQDDWDRVDYLNPAAVQKFIELTHEVYYENFKEYFSEVIDSAFYDEPQFYGPGGRMWTENFNEKFIKKYGPEVNPALLYPSLWYNIGEETSYARNMLLGFRAELYSLGFPKTLQDWCSEHKITLTGHVDQEEVINPVGMTGDLMKSFKYQDIPGFDEVFLKRRGSKIYKIISSSAYNWDKKLVMSECFGGMPENPSIDDMYKEVMEQFSKGMNLFVPHAVWTNDDPKKVIFKPELSYRNNDYRYSLKYFNEYCARVAYLLQGGRHMADIGVLYPIYGLTSAFHFEWGEDPYLGGPNSDEFDYQEIGEILSSYVRKDYTFIHPEVLDEKCSVANGLINLENEINFESYKVFILPGSSTMSISNIKKIREFYNQGGTIIATSMFAFQSVEKEKDVELQEIMSSIFGEISYESRYHLNSNTNNGKAYFIRKPTKELLKEIIEDSLLVFDINIELDNKIDGIFSYIHKIKDDIDIYYFANASDKDINAKITINTSKQLECWNPHNGNMSKLENYNYSDGLMNLELSIPAVHSIALVSFDNDRI